MNFINVVSLLFQLSLARTEIPSEIGRVRKIVESTSDQISRLEEKLETVKHDVLDHTHSIKPMVVELGALINRMQEVQRYAHYLSTVVKIEDIRCVLRFSFAEFCADDFCMDHIVYI